MSLNESIDKNSKELNIYNFRMNVNMINSLSLNNIIYHSDINEKIKKINKNTQKLNEHIRRSLPILSINTRNFLLNETIRLYKEIECQLNNTIVQTQKKDLFIAQEILENDAKYEVNKIILIIDLIVKKQLEFCDNISSYYLIDDINKIKAHYQNQQQTIEQEICDKKIRKIELQQKIDILISSEEIISQRKLKKIFEKALPDEKDLSLLDIPVNEIAILKQALRMITSVIDNVDLGLEFDFLVRSRIHFSDLLFNLTNGIQTNENQCQQIDTKLLLLDEILTLNQCRKYCIQQTLLLNEYWQGYTQKLVLLLQEERIINKLVNIFRQLTLFIESLEYQYNRPLAD